MTPLVGLTYYTYMAFYSKRHYRAVSPPADTAADIAARKAHYAALEAAGADVKARYPGGITLDNAAEVLAYQAERIAARIKEIAR